jgi:hypothetical protein
VTLLSARVSLIVLPESEQVLANSFKPLLESVPSHIHCGGRIVYNPESECRRIFAGRDVETFVPRRLDGGRVFFNDWGLRPEHEYTIRCANFLNGASILDGVRYVICNRALASLPETATRSTPA